MRDALYHLERARPATLQAQIRELLVESIRNGQLKGGDPVPSTRAMAARLQVSRNTVTLAYQTLATEGFLASRERAMAWTLDHVDEAAKIVARELRLPLEVAKFQITHLGQWEFMSGEPNADRARHSIKTFVDYYIKQGDDILGERRLNPQQIDAFVDGRFFVGGTHSIYQ